MKRIPILSLFAANAISNTGNVLATIAIPWFVLQTTGSAAQTGITGFFTILPVVVAGFLGGALIDRLGYKPTSIIADLASGVTVALIPLLQSATSTAPVCQVEHGTEVNVLEVQRDVEKKQYYFRVRAPKCDGWVPETALATRKVPPIGRGSRK